MNFIKQIAVLVMVATLCNSNTIPNDEDIAAIETIRREKMAEERNEHLLEQLEDAFKSRSEQSLLELFSESVTCGPFLWDELESNYPELYENSTHSAQFVTFSSYQGYPETTPNFPFALFTRENGDIEQSVVHIREQFVNRRDFTAREAVQEEEFQFYRTYSIATHDDPAFVVESQENILFVQFDTTGMIKAIDLLNDFDAKFDTIFRAKADKSYEEVVAPFLERFSTREEAANAFIYGGNSALFNDTDFDRALYFYQMGVLLDPENPDGYSGQGMVINNGVKYKRMSPQLLGDAMWCGNKAMELEPTEPRIKGDMAWTCLYLSDYVNDDEREELLLQADSLCSVAIEMEPDFGQYYYINSNVKLFQLDFDGAREYAIKAEEREFDFPPNYLDVIDTYESQFNEDRSDEENSEEESSVE